MMRGGKPRKGYFQHEKNADRGEFQWKLAAIGVRLLAFNASRDSDRDRGSGIRTRSLPNAKPKPRVGPLGQAGAAGFGGLVGLITCEQENECTRPLCCRRSQQTLSNRQLVIY